MYLTPSSPFSFFFIDTATSEIYTLSLHDALPISVLRSNTGRRLAKASRDWLSRGPLSRRMAPDLATPLTEPFLAPLAAGADRKSTRLNSSHRAISYAVFCLKKKKKIQ